MNKEDIKNYLKNNLELEYKESGGDYGSHTFKEIKLILEDEEISSIFIDE